MTRELTAWERAEMERWAAQLQAEFDALSESRREEGHKTYIQRRAERFRLDKKA